MNKDKASGLRERMFGALIELLGDDGPAIKAGYLAQGPQRDYSQRVVESMCRGLEEKTAVHALFLNAATGTGKTLGYSVPAVIAAGLGYKVGIVTNSHHLQRQMLGTSEEPGDLALAAKWVSGGVRIARRVGRQAFVSAAAVADVINALRQDERNVLSKAESMDLLELQDWANESNQLGNSGLIEDAVALFGGDLPAGISTTQIALDADSPSQDFAAYKEHVRASGDADIVLMTHAFLASSALYRRGELIEGGLDFLIVDEADLLIDVASNQFRFGLSLDRFVRMCSLLPERTGQALTSAAVELRSFAGGLFDGEQAVPLELMSQAARSGLARRLDGVRVALSGASAEILGSTDIDLRESMRDAQEFIERLGRAGEGGFFASALSFSKSRRLPSLSLMPVNPAALLRGLWTGPQGDGEPETSEGNGRRIKALVFTSATLSSPGRGDSVGRFREAAYSLGLPTHNNSQIVLDSDIWAEFEPERFGSVRYILADPAVEAPVRDFDESLGTELREEWVQYAASMILAAHRAGGRTLVLARSYRDVAVFADKLRELGHTGEVIAQVRGQKMDALAQRFAADPMAIWISPLAWEGLNLPGMIQNLVVLRLPFQQPDPVKRALMTSRGRLTKESADAIIQALAMNSAKRLLRQGLGRAIRKRDDRARIWIADGRFPLPASSPLTLKHPADLVWSEKRQYPAMHAVVERRFQVALTQAAVLLKDGRVLTP